MKETPEAMRLMSKLETELRREERRHRDGIPGMRRDVADLLLRAADEIAKLREETRKDVTR